VEVANTNSNRLASSVTHANTVLVIVPNVSHSAVQSVQRHARRSGAQVIRATRSSSRYISERIREIVREEVNR